MISDDTLTAQINYLCIVYMLTQLFEPNIVSSLGIFNHTIAAYELTNYQITLKRFKRTLPNFELENEKWDDLSEIEIQFRSFKKEFRLKLREDLKFQDFNQASQSSFLNRRSKFYEGILDDDPVNSFIIGYTKNNDFYAVIRSDNVSYYIEPANIFLMSEFYTGQIIVYRDMDVVSNGNVTSDKIDYKNMIWNLFGFGRIHILPNGVDKSEYLKGNLACQIELVADHTLYNYFKKDDDTVRGFLYLHGKYADFIFRRTDFDGDGKPDNVRITVQRITIYKSIQDQNYPMARTIDLRSTLTKFSFRTQTYCLSILFCFKRDASSPVIGEAFRAGSKRTGPPGGICQKPFKKLNRYRSFNTAVVTIKSSKYVALPLVTTLLAVSHEIGHSFGSDHDPLDDLSCSPGGSKGFYIMYPKSVSYLRKRNAYFSTCSRKEIHDIILKRGECLKIYPSVCGNGIREGEEDCDCGNSGVCDSLDPCCTPSDAKLPEKGCKFRHQKGSQCSPKENLCCSKECKITSDSNSQCFYDSCKISFCDGKNYYCPEPVNAPDKYPCQGLSKSCNKGSCNSSVCLDNGLKDCTCQEIKTECIICCLKDNRCVPASKLGFTTPTGEIYVSTAGTSCNNRRFQCDDGGTCIDGKYRKHKGQKDSSHDSLWWILTILATVFMILIFIFGYILRKHILQI